MKSKTKTEILYTCPDEIVTVIRKTGGLRRYPRHNYPCLIFVLKPKDGTRSCKTADGRVEFMPSWAELRALLAGLDPELAKSLPVRFKNKCVQRKRRFDALNARRHWKRQAR